MDTCPSLGDLIKYKDNVLAPNQTDALRTHISRCDQCREQLEFLEFVEAHYGEAIDTLPPADERHLKVIELAAYIDRSLRYRERDRVELHLSRCSDCLDKLISVKKLIEGVDLTKSHPPESVIQRAIAMGKEPRGTTPMSQSERLLSRVRQWLWPMAGPRRMAWVAANIIVIIGIVYILKWSVYQGPKPPLQELPVQQMKSQMAFDHRIPLTPEIALVLSGYEKGGPTKEEEDILLKLLAKEASTLPIDQIKRLQLDKGLIAQMGELSGSSMVLRMQLMKNGTLRLTPAKPPHRELPSRQPHKSNKGGARIKRNKDMGEVTE